MYFEALSYLVKKDGIDTELPGRYQIVTSCQFLTSPHPL